MYNSSNSTARKHFFNFINKTILFALVFLNSYQINETCPPQVNFAYSLSYARAMHLFQERRLIRTQIWSAKGPVVKQTIQLRAKSLKKINAVNSAHNCGCNCVGVNVGCRGTIELTLWSCGIHNRMSGSLVNFLSSNLFFLSFVITYGCNFP